VFCSSRQRLVDCRGKFCNRGKARDHWRWRGGLASCFAKSCLDMPKAKGPKQAGSNVAADDYNAVVQIADLIDIKLIHTTFDVVPALFLSEKDQHKFGYGCEFEHGYYRGEDNVLIGTFKLEAGSKQGRRWLLRAKSTYLVMFDVEGNPSEEAALSYLSRIGKFACYPYFRSHFAALCSNAGAEMPPLPVMRGNLPKKIPPADVEQGKLSAE
jgi:hypothetical protein